MADAARLLVDRLAREHLDWCGRLRVEEAGAERVITGDVPGRRGHELFVLLREREATVAYSDGLPPGPAEKLFIWGEASTAGGLDAVARFVEDLMSGQIVLARVRIPLLARLIRRDGAGSLLRFVPAAELAGWSSRRRRAIERTWAWSPDRKLAI